MRMIHSALHFRVRDRHVVQILYGRTVRCHSRISPRPLGKVRNLTGGCTYGRTTLQFELMIRKSILEKKSLTSLTRVLPGYHLPSSSKMRQAWALLSSEMLLVHVAVPNASPLEHVIVWWVRHSKGAFSQKVPLKLLTCEAGRRPG